MSEIKLFGYNSDTEIFDPRYMKRPRGEHKIYCCYCRRELAKENVTRDHLHPRILGGNITRKCCAECNKEKGKMTLPKYILFLEAQQRLLSTKTDEWRKRETQRINAEKLLLQMVKKQGLI